MAPEQLEGREADTRTDIFALGAVLYEMVTGRKAFEGASQASLISAIMAANPPPIVERQPLAPPALERVIRTCLARDPADRFDSAHDLLIHLKWLAEGGSQAGVAAPVAARRRARERIAWVTATATAVAAAVFAALYATTPTRTLRPVRFTMPATGTGYANAFGATPSPNGRELAFVARGADRRRQIYIRGLNTLEPRPIDGTTDAEPFLFWSPDSRFIGFFGDGKLRKVPAAGGAPQVVSQLSGSTYGASWSSDGTILFGSQGGGLQRVSAAGGTSEPLTTLDAGQHEIGHSWPYFLPDGRRFLYLVNSRPPDTRADTHVLYIGSLDSKERTRLVAGVSRAEYAAPANLVYVRDGTLFAAPFDVGSGRITGDPIAIAEGVNYFGPTGGAEFGTSHAGVLTFTPAGAQASHQLVWVDRSGKRTGALSATGSFDVVRLSPNGRQVAVGLTDPRTGTVDLWLYGVDRDTATRLTFDPRWESFPVWTPDGSRIAFASDHAGMPDIYVMPVDGSGSEKVLVRAEGTQVPSDWSLDGRFLLYWSDADVWVLPMTGDRKPFAFTTTPFEEHSPRFSPDGRWIAYQSLETGGPQVYVRAFPGPGAKMQISTRGGDTPRWRRDGRELYFQNERQLFAVSFDTATGRAGEPRLLFELPQAPLAYEVAPDGARFLMQLEAEGRTQPPTTVLLDWFQALRR
jgi:Tol biopolymer transport system component